MTWRLLLFPFALVYGAVVRLRNFFFDAGLLTSKSFNLPVISVGNLSTGGSGKTPHVEYLIRLLSGNYKTATLSRGYGRRTSGYLEVKLDSLADDCGDEPLQYKQKFPGITVSVCEKRAEGIAKLLTHQPEVILLDDAFQHRYVQPSLNILLTDWSKPFFNDHLLPAGNLREPVSGKERADVIIVTKCPVSMSSSERADYIRKINPQKGQEVLFSFLTYGELRPVNAPVIAAELYKDHSVLMVTGIANPQPMQQYLLGAFKEVVSLRFPDHHRFTDADVQLIAKKIDNIAVNRIIITTEKDKTRLGDLLAGLPLYVLPVEIAFNENDRTHFEQYILNHVGKNKTNG